MSKGNLIWPQKYYGKHGYDTKYRGDETICGTGSLLASCQEWIKVLISTVKEYEIKTISDIGCGDFNWIKASGLEKFDVDYLGYDIFPRGEYSTDFYKIYKRKFDIVKRSPRNSDLIICKDVLNHFTLKDALSALENIKAKTNFLLVTQCLGDNERFYEETYIKKDPLSWLNYNLDKDPFGLEPYKVSMELCKHVKKREKNWHVALYKFE